MAVEIRRTKSYERFKADLKKSTGEQVISAGNKAVQAARAQAFIGEVEEYNREVFRGRNVDKYGTLSNGITLSTKPVIPEVIYEIAKEVPANINISTSDITDRVILSSTGMDVAYLHSKNRYMNTAVRVFASALKEARKK